MSSNIHSKKTVISSFDDIPNIPDMPCIPDMLLDIPDIVVFDVVLTEDSEYDWSAVTVFNCEINANTIPKKIIESRIKQD